MDVNPVKPMGHEIRKVTEFERVAPFTLRVAFGAGSAILHNWPETGPELEVLARSWAVRTK